MTRLPTYCNISFWLFTLPLNFYKKKSSNQAEIKLTSESKSFKYFWVYPLQRQDYQVPGSLKVKAVGQTEASTKSKQQLENNLNNSPQSSSTKSKSNPTPTKSASLSSASTYQDSDTNTQANQQI